MLTGLRPWIECESPTFDAAAVNRMMDLAAWDLAGLGATVERIAGRMNLGGCLRVGKRPMTRCRIRSEEARQRRQTVARSPSRKQAPSETDGSPHGPSPADQRPFGIVIAEGEDQFLLIGQGVGLDFQRFGAFTLTLGTAPAEYRRHSQNTLN